MLVFFMLSLYVLYSNINFSSLHVKIFSSFQFSSTLYIVIAGRFTFLSQRQMLDFPVLVRVVQYCVLIPSLSSWFICFKYTLSSPLLYILTQFTHSNFLQIVLWTIVTFSPDSFGTIVSFSPDSFGHHCIIFPGQYSLLKNENYLPLAGEMIQHTKSLN